MPRVKNLNIVTTYGETGYVINDLGQDKSPRFELYHIPTKKSIKNQIIHYILMNIWIKFGKKRSKLMMLNKILKRQKVQLEEQINLIEK